MERSTLPVIWPNRNTLLKSFRPTGLELKGAGKRNQHPGQEDKVKERDKMLCLQKKENGDHMLLLQFCNGGNLEDFIKIRGGKLDEKQAHFILKQIVNGIRDQNNHRIMHRDLKPANIGIVFEGERFDNDQRKKYIEQFDF